MSDLYGLKFDPTYERDRIIKFIQTQFKEANKDFAVVGISGGKDSTVAAALCAEALGHENVVGVMMPNGYQSDIEDSELVIDSLNIRRIQINIVNCYQEMISRLSDAYREFCCQTSWALKFNDPLHSGVKFNVPPRLRMTVLYGVAQAIHSGLVINTCNRSEDYIGWSTKYGDSAGDIAPLQHLTKTEVVMVGESVESLKELKHLVYKEPADGLTADSDEINFGFTYSELDRYILTGQCVDAKNAEIIKEWHNRNLHKISPMPHLEAFHKGGQY